MARTPTPQLGRIGLQPSASPVDRMVSPAVQGEAPSSLTDLARSLSGLSSTLAQRFDQSFNAYKQGSMLQAQADMQSMRIESIEQFDQFAKDNKLPATWSPWYTLAAREHVSRTEAINTANQIREEWEKVRYTEGIDQDDPAAVDAFFDSKVQHLLNPEKRGPWEIAAAMEVLSQTKQQLRNSHFQQRLVEREYEMQQAVRGEAIANASNPAALQDTLNRARNFMSNKDANDLILQAVSAAYLDLSKSPEDIENSLRNLRKENGSPVFATPTAVAMVEELRQQRARAEEQNADQELRALKRNQELNRTKAMSIMADNLADFEGLTGKQIQEKLQGFGVQLAMDDLANAVRLVATSSPEEDRAMSMVTEALLIAQSDNRPLTSGEVQNIAIALQLVDDNPGNKARALALASQNMGRVQTDEVANELVVAQFEEEALLGSKTLEDVLTVSRQYNLSGTHVKRLTDSVKAAREQTSFDRDDFDIKRDSLNRLLETSALSAGLSVVGQTTDPTHVAALKEASLQLESEWRNVQQQLIMTPEFRAASPIERYKMRNDAFAAFKSQVDLTQYANRFSSLISDMKSETRAIESIGTITPNPKVTDIHPDSVKAMYPGLGTYVELGNDPVVDVPPPSVSTDTQSIAFRGFDGGVVFRDELTSRPYPYSYVMNAASRGFNASSPLTPQMVIDDYARLREAPLPPIDRPTAEARYQNTMRSYLSQVEAQMQNLGYQMKSPVARVATEAQKEYTRLLTLARSIESTVGRSPDFLRKIDPNDRDRIVANTRLVGFSWELDDDQRVKEIAYKAGRTIKTPEDLNAFRDLLKQGYINGNPGDIDRR